MRTKLAFLFLLIATNAFSQEQPAPDFCKIPGEDGHRVLLYKGCIASKAKEFEVTGDSASDVTTAAVGACAEYRAKMIEYMNSCTPGFTGGEKVMDNLAASFHDWGVQSAITFRAMRLKAQGGSKKSN